MGREVIKLKRRILGAKHLRSPRECDIYPTFHLPLEWKTRRNSDKAARMQTGLSGKVQQTERKGICKCKKPPLPLHSREWPQREWSASSILFSRLWNTEITKHWLKMAVSFVLLHTAKGLWEVFTGSSSANGCWVVLTFQKKKKQNQKTRTSCLQVHSKWHVDWLGSKRN